MNEGVVDGCLRYGSLVRGWKGTVPEERRMWGIKSVLASRMCGWLVWNCLDEQHLGFLRLVDRAISCIIERVNSV